MNRRTTAYAVFGVLAYLATMFATVPAPWASQVVAHISNRTLELRAPSDSLWSGSGHLFLVGRSSGLHELGRLSWETSFIQLWKGQLSVELTLADQPATIDVLVSPTSVLIRGLHIKLPASIAADALPMLRGLRPDGAIVLHSENLRLEKDSIVGQASLEWRNARFEKISTASLGSFRANLRGTGAVVHIRLEEVQGPLRLVGLGAWGFASDLALSGAIEHDPDVPDEVTELLAALCGAYSNNRCSFRIPGGV